MLSGLVDIQRVGQYFYQATRVRQVWESTRDDVGFIGQVRRGLLPLPTDRPAPYVDPFPPLRRRRHDRWADRRVAVIATGGSGALASMVGVVRALQEADVHPVAYGVSSGSALFGIPLAAGMSAADVARATLALQPRDYLDPDWLALLKAPLRLGRGWSGIVKGDRLEAAYREILGDVTLGELPVPVWFPLWNIERNRLEYIGPDSHPDLLAARAVRMAVALPLAVQPNPLDGGWWLDGGIVDILPAGPFVGTDRCDTAVVVNCFYPPGFAGDEVRGWEERPLSILSVADQTKTMAHLQLARRSMADLRQSVGDVVVLEPVPYAKVHGAGLYGQFLDSREWPDFMADGYQAMAATLGPGDLPQAIT